MVSTLNKYVFVLWLAMYVGRAFGAEAACISCHKGQVNAWQGSDHAKAMSVANSNAVIGDFSGVSQKHYTQSARFYIKEGAYLIDFTEQAKTHTYEVKYTFGHFPLQQYLVPSEGGRLQVFPFAWDSRPKSEGGQRWYVIYADEDIQSEDRLHWLQPLQNWNGMCADCHSDGLKRNYDVAKNQFDTDWSNINVGCESCHGDMKGHQRGLPRANATPTDSDDLTWLRNLSEKVARLKNSDGELASKQEKEQHGRFMDNCFACHALRTPLTDGFVPHTPLLDQFSPSFLTPPMYHADGQIKDEVYVYGSFQQSKMYEQGVTCLNCHDAHTMKVKTKSNALCLQCHNPEEYQQERHTRHPLESEGGQCVNCHMPETTYMGVDARRDHSFKIPRPDLADQYDLPQACDSCHQDKSSQWAAKQLAQWHGKPDPQSKSEQAYLELMHNQGLALTEHLALINDSTIPVIKRASAIMMLPYSTDNLAAHQVKPWIKSDEALIRLAMARVGNLIPEVERPLLFADLLKDELKAVRVASAMHLVSAKLKDLTLLNRALNELFEVNDINSWRAEGQFNQSLLLLQQKRFDAAIEALRHSIKVEPHFVPAYVNLAEIYRQLNQSESEALTYVSALKRNPNSAEIHYAQGMFLIRSGNKASSIPSFQRAMQIDPSNSQYAYLYFLALDATGKTAEALVELRKLIAAYQNDANLVNLALSLAQKTGDRESFEYFVKLR